MNALIVGLGYSLGPTVASLLLAVLPWPWLFGLQAPLGLVGCWLAWRYLPRTELAKSDKPYDRVLALLAAVCFASLVFTLSAIAQQKGLAVVLVALGLMLGSRTTTRRTRRRRKTGVQVRIILATDQTARTRKQAPYLRP